MKYSGILRGLGLWWLLLSVATVAAAPCDTLRVAFLTDIHVTPGNTQDSLLRIAIDEINASTCDIVLLGGDLTNLGSDAELEHVHALISRLRKPWCAVPGNHETTWSESACTTFARIFGHERAYLLSRRRLSLSGLCIGTVHEDGHGRRAHRRPRMAG